MKRCPQCDSLHCGPIACRFSGLTNDAFHARQELIEENKANDYAEAMRQKDVLQMLATVEHDIFGRPLKEGT